MTGWLEADGFGRHEYDELARGALSVPGVTSETPLVAVPRCGIATDLPLAARWGPEEILDAWR